jgi:flagellar protein FlaG
MSVEFGHLLGAGRVYPVRPTAPVRPPERPAAEPAASPRAVDRVELSLAATPPPEALAMVDRAAQRVEELAAENRELHFTYNEAARRVVVEVRDLDGQVIRTIPPASALEVLAGAVLRS